MSIKLYNYLTHKKEIFKSLHAKSVGLYACGLTVYNYAHIGNLRTYIFEDILKRVLEYNGYNVKHIMNITDIEDKIIRDSKIAGKTIYEFVKPYEKAFFIDLKKLNIKPASLYPKATKHIKEMIKIIETLVKKKLAYKADESIYFDVSKFKKYGRLSGVKTRELKIGARVDADEYTKNEAEDFVLWKGKKIGKPSWDAPFGAGRPGWHIECSAMSMKYLGPTFDIHAGAVDLIFPHHENEIAQSEGSTGKKFVNFFIEGEHLLVDNKKMSKSLGNFYTLRDIEKRSFDPITFRYLILTAHYRSKLNFTWESLESAQNALEKLRETVLSLKKVKQLVDEKILKQYRKKFEYFINSDLNAPAALALLWEVLKSSKLNDGTKYALIVNFDKIFGLNLANTKSEKIPSQVLKLVKERETFRKENNFTKADELRKKIESLGWLIEDTSKGFVIKRT